jgi:hypothetical protein
VEVAELMVVIQLVSAAAQVVVFVEVLLVTVEQAMQVGILQ